MARVLLFNFTAEVRRKKVKALLFRLGIPSREVPPEEQGMTLGALLNEQGLDPGISGKEETEGRFTGEMLVMHNLTPGQFHGLLDGLKRQGVLVPLKAVTTAANLRWTAVQLHAELMAEREALQAGAAAVHPEG